MHADDELERWQREWRAQPAVPLDLRRMVERDLRSRHLNLLASIAVTAIMGGGTALWAAHSGDRDWMVLAFVVWVFIAVAWALTLQLEWQRGPRPHADSTAAFLDYAIRSRRSRLQALTASVVLYIILFVFVLVWRYRTMAEATRDPWLYLTSARVLTLLAISAVLAVLAVVHRRRLDRELHSLVKMHDALEK